MGLDATAKKTSAAPKQAVLAALLAAALGGIAAAAQADSYDVLLEKLRAKGVISDSEYGEFQTLREDDMKAAEKSGKDEAKIKFKDGFTLESADGANSISIEGRIQADYRSFNIDSGSGATPSSATADTFDVRRAYFGVKGKLYKDWTFETTYDVANSSLEYAYINYKWNDAVQARAGAFKYQFSFEEITSSRFTDFQERSLVNAWVPGKDQGVMIHGEPVKNTFAYAVGVANGGGKNTDEANSAVDGKDLIGRAAINFAPMAALKDWVLHLGGNYATGTIPAGSVGSARTEGRGLTFFTGTGPAGTEMDRKRTSVEGVVSMGPVKLQSEWLKANYSGDGGFDQDVNVYYVAANWLITGEKYADNYTLGGIKAIKPNSPVGGGGIGAWELGVRFSKLDAGDFATSATSTNKADAVTVGLKWIPNTNTRLLLNYVQTKFDTPINIVNGTTDEEKAITMRAQIFF